MKLANRVRDLALFNLAINSKLRGSDLVKLKLRDIAHGDHFAKRVTIMQYNMHNQVQFEITEQTREAILNWVVDGLKWRNKPGLMSWKRKRLVIS